MNKIVTLFLAFKVREPTDDLIQKYQVALNTMLEAMEGFASTLAALNQKDYE